MSFTQHLKPLAVVYDGMDELSAFKGASPALKEYEAELSLAGEFYRAKN
ncbi:MAG: hypothetical protein WBB28_13315 [Crinalium sp.]